MLPFGPGNPFLPVPERALFGPAPSPACWPSLCPRLQPALAVLSADDSAPGSHGGPLPKPHRALCTHGSLPGLCWDSGSQAALACVPNPAAHCKSQVLFLKPPFLGVLSVHALLRGHSTLGRPFQLLPPSRPAPCSLVLKHSSLVTCLQLPRALVVTRVSAQKILCRSRTVSPKVWWPERKQ